MDIRSEALLTSGQMARELGTTVPRVLRAVHSGHVSTVRHGNRFLFDTAALEQLRRRWGLIPLVPGLSREDVLVLAALGRRPLGLRSIRAVARAAGVSPTTAARSLHRLAEQGYVTRETALVAEGEVRDVAVWIIRWTEPAWLQVADTVGRGNLPSSPATPAGPTRRARGGLPSRLAHLFWNEPGTLDVDQHATLVADRILRSDDPEAHAWMLQRLPPTAILKATRTRNLDPPRVRLGRLLAHTAR